MIGPAHEFVATSSTATRMCASGEDWPRPVTQCPHPHLRFAALANAFGFDGASYFLFGLEHDLANPAAHWSTADARWLRTYRRNNLGRLDPRLIEQSENAALVWSADAVSDRPDSARFLQLGAKFSIGSGVVFSFCNDQMGRAVMCWDCSEPKLNVERQLAIARAFGTLTLVSSLLLESVWSRPHLHRQYEADYPCLTAREFECLELAANGMTSGDISVKLGISQRTANFHFGNIIGKLQALNRGEAIARAIALGLYRPPPRVWAFRAQPSQSSRAAITAAASLRAPAKPATPTSNAPSRAA